MNPRYTPVAERAAHRCEYCHAPESIFNFSFEVEHILPSAHGGGADETNRALACRACNLYKSDHLTADEPSTGKSVRLFHPRQQRWAEHFEVDKQSSTIRGLTAVGRATVLRLQMNSPVQLEARRLWTQLGLFP